MAFSHQNLSADELAMTPLAPIGIFDSGVGGLTVARQIARLLPNESLIYVGDTKRCPYGPRNLEEVKVFVYQIGNFLESLGVKLIVIACNTATAAGLAAAQKSFKVPVIGVVQPGARAAVRATVNRRVGVLATKGTIESNIYNNALKMLDAGIEVFQKAAPEFVRMAEKGLFENDFEYSDEDVLQAKEYLQPMKDEDIDTLVLGCTHFPLLKPLISQIMGGDVALISSADETAREVKEALRRKGQLVPESLQAASHTFYTSSTDLDSFRDIGSKIFETELQHVKHVDFA